MKHLFIAGTVAVLCGSACADGIDFRYSGFGTIGAVVTNNSDAEYRSTAREATGATRKVDYGTDSVIGLQGNATFNETFSAVGQLLASRRVGSDGVPVVEWLYGQAKLPAGFQLKLGRIVLPIFMVSETRAVGYAQHWQRPPVEVYDWYAPSFFDGGQLQYDSSFGPVNLTVQASAGRSKNSIELGGTVTAVNYPNLRSVSVQATYGNWLARFAQTRGDLHVPLFGTAPFSDTFNAAGIQYDDSKLIVMGEYVTRKNTLSSLDMDAWYLTSGWRFGSWLPYAQYSQHAPKDGAAKDKTTAAGLRWDAIKNVDIKAQVARVIGGDVTFVKATPAFLAERPAVMVYSLAADFVF